MERSYPLEGRRWLIDAEWCELADLALPEGAIENAFREALGAQRSIGGARPGATSEPGATPDLDGSTTPPPRTENPDQGG